jgi:hypothetical protein
MLARDARLAICQSVADRQIGYVDAQRALQTLISAM